MSSNLDRRHFLKLGSAAAIAGFEFTHRSFAADAEVLYSKVIPTRKGLDSKWADSLAKRGTPLDAAITSKVPDELSKIGMTVGGIGCGTVYLSGDGQLYIWDIFNKTSVGVVFQRLKDIPEGLETLDGQNKIVRLVDGANYIKPPTPEDFPNPFRQEFVLHVDGEKTPRTMNRHDWSQVCFNGRWPMATIEYSDPDCPLNGRLQAWSPFIPLDLEDSTLPVTVMEYTLTNTSDKPVDGSFTGFWENPVLIHSRKKANHHVVSSVSEIPEGTILHHQAGKDAPAKAFDWGSTTLSTLGKSEPTTDRDGLCHRFKLAPDESRTFRFLLTWHFPNLNELHEAMGPQQPYYTTRFANAAEVSKHVMERFETLGGSTRKWAETWNDSTLPQWFLDRTILTTNTLQTTNCHILAGENYPEGRFWAWEGIGCCAGTCAHVWHYAQGVARLFPSLERNVREISDYGIGFNEDGSINFRAECNDKVAIDSQAGIILRTWREHLQSSNESFLVKVWPKDKKALQWLIDFDREGRGGLDGLLDGEQHNTLDAEWYGKVHCLCSLYLAALKAGEAMAKIKGIEDDAFARKCADIHKAGSKKIATLFNGEFYEQQEDPEHLDKIGVGKGCYIDQVIGQWWAHQVGLGRIYNPEHIHSALHSLWKYNFVPHVGNFRQVFKRGRFYALNGESGLIMCTWPKGGLRDGYMKHRLYGYFNECMTGFEWQVAAHMIQEGDIIEDLEPNEAASLLESPDDPRSLTLRGLAVGRAIHDRYHPSMRNPYNEIECSDHYARANASYSLFLAACGFQYDGPGAMIGFAPKINPNRFKAAFTTAEGWGSYQQRYLEEHWRAEITLSRGSLTLRQIQLPWINVQASMELNGKAIQAAFINGAAQLDQEITLKDGDQLVIVR